MAATLIAGRYEMLRTLGKGGGGTCFLVRDHAGDAPLALKTLQTDQVSGALQQAFERECAVLQDLSHPHLARILDFGRDGDLLFYASEYVEGSDFAAECRTRDWNAVFALVVQGCWALQYLGERNVMHRDIKPGNILVGKVHVPDQPDNQDRLVLKIIDFGLAVSQEARPAAASPTGTLAYIAPEILAKRPFDHRSDLYSWGVVLYEMAFGRLPFAKAKNFSQYLQSLVHGEVDLTPLRESGEIPLGVIEVIGRLLQKDPQRRPENAQEIIVILNEIESENFPLVGAGLVSARSTDAVTKGPRHQRPWRGRTQGPPLQGTDHETPQQIVEKLLSLIRSGKRTEAWDWAEANFSTMEAEPDASIVEKFYGAATHVLIEQGRYGEAEGLLRRMGASVEAAILRIQLAYREGNLAQAKKYMEEIPGPLLASATLEQQTRLENYAALVAQGMQQYEESARRFEKAAELSEQSGRKDHRLSALVNAGSLNQEQGRWKKAYELFQSALLLAREIGHESLKANLLNNLGNLYLYFGRLREAEASFSESLEVARRQDLKPLVAYNLYLLTVGEEGKGNWERVQLYLQEALSYARELGESKPILQAALAQGYFFLTREDYAGCEQTIEEIRAKARQFEQQDYELQADWLEAKLRLRQGKKEFPIAGWLDRAEEDARRRGLKNNLWQIAADRGDLAALLGDKPSAEQAYQTALKIIDELKSEVPDEFQNSFLRDRKKEKIRQALEKVRGGNVADMLPTGGDINVGARFIAPASKDVVQQDFSLPIVVATPHAGAINRAPTILLRSEAMTVSQQDAKSISFQKWSEINRRLLMQHGVDRLLEEILDAAIQLTDAERGFIILSDTQELDIRAARNLDQESLKKEEERVSQTIAQEVMRKGESTVILDAQTEERFAEARSVHALSLRSVLCVPLRLGLRTVGLVYLDNRFRQGVFLPEHIPLIETLADQASLALEHARLHRENRDKIEELQKSRELIEKLNARLERELIDTTADLEAMREGLKRQQEEVRLRYTYDKIVGESAPIRSVLKVLDRIVDTHSPVFIHGESGTGKELIAQAVHYNGPRKDQPFISENCSALAESLLESELFGHVRGAFTGAEKDKLGLFHMAHKGTLFLDEVGDMSTSMQAKLLRVLQEGEVRQVGGQNYRKVDVRILSASHKDLKQLVEQGAFRQDLYYRLNVLRIDLPSLRERREDIPLLIDHFLKQAAEKDGQKKARVNKAALKILMDYAWPGNIRELQNEVQRLLVLGSGEITADLISGAILKAVQKSRGIDLQGGLETSVAAVEKKAIVEAMERYRGNKVKVAKALKIGRRTLYAKLKLYDIRSDLGKSRSL